MIKKSEKTTTEAVQKARRIKGNRENDFKNLTIRLHTVKSETDCEFLLLKREQTMWERERRERGV